MFDLLMWFVKVWIIMRTLFMWKSCVPGMRRC